MDAYGTFAASSSPSPVAASPAWRRGLLRLAGAAGVVALALASISSFSSISVANERVESPGGLSEAEQQFLAGISRSSMKEFLHAYSRSL